jgi:hypothetical protein
MARAAAYGAACEGIARCTKDDEEVGALYLEAGRALGLEAARASARQNMRLGESDMPGGRVARLLSPSPGVAARAQHCRIWANRGRICRIECPLSGARKTQPYDHQLGSSLRAHFAAGGCAPEPGCGGRVLLHLSAWHPTCFDCPAYRKLSTDDRAMFGAPRAKRSRLHH